MEGIFALVLLAASTALNTAQAQPTSKEVYRDTKTGLIVFADSRDKSIFWYVPRMTLSTVDGKANFRKNSKPSKDGTIKYSFVIKPEFDESDAQLLKSYIPGLRSIQQLKPVTAKRFGIQVPAYTINVMTPEVTNFSYVNNEQLLRFALDSDLAFEMDDDLQYLKPGVPANIYIAYDADKTTSFANIKLTVDDVKKSLGIGAGGAYKFLKADITRKVSDYVANRNIDIKVKGEVPDIIGIIDRVTDACFAKLNDTNNNNDDWDWSRSGRSRHSGDGFGGDNGSGNQNDKPGGGGGKDDGPFTDPFTPGKDTGKTGGNSTDEPDPLDDTPPKKDDDGKGGKTDSKEHVNELKDLQKSLDFYGQKQKSSNGSRTSGQSVDATGDEEGDGVWLKYSPEKETCKGTIYYNQEKISDSKEIVAVTTYLTANLKQVAKQKVDLLGSKDFRITGASTKSNPYKTGIIVKPNDHWTLTTSFEFWASTYFTGRNRAHLRWDSEWPSPDADLYYRIGDGPWTSVAGRSIADSIEEGELQFYIDRSALWTKLPLENIREGKKIFGAVVGSPLIQYSRFYPEYVLKASGKRVTLTP